MRLLAITMETTTCCQMPWIRSYGKPKAKGLAISLRFGGNKDDRIWNHRQGLGVFFVAVFQAMGKMGNTGDSYSSFSSTCNNGKSAPQSGCQCKAL